MLGASLVTCKIRTLLNDIVWSQGCLRQRGQVELLTPGSCDQGLTATWRIGIARTLIICWKILVNRILSYYIRYMGNENHIIHCISITKGAISLGDARSTAPFPSPQSHIPPVVLRSRCALNVASSSHTNSLAPEGEGTRLRRCDCHDATPTGSAPSSRLSARKGKLPPFSGLIIVA